MSRLYVAQVPVERPAEHFYSFFLGSYTNAFVYPYTYNSTNCLYTQGDRFAIDVYGIRCELNVWNAPYRLCFCLLFLLSPSSLFAAVVVVSVVAVSVYMEACMYLRNRTHRRAMKARKHTKFNTLKQSKKKKHKKKPERNQYSKYTKASNLNAEWNWLGKMKNITCSKYICYMERNTSESCNTNYRVNFIFVHMHTSTHNDWWIACF